MSYKDRYNEWLNDPNIDEITKDELKSITDEKEIEDRFFKDLEFGTAGLRGVIGAGTNRMNKYTVGKATQGLANYIVKQGGNCAAKGVAIAYDSRNMSPEFAEYSALVLNASNIKAYVFDELKPTPELSFALRHLGCTAGVVITASHNPPAYNGYKVYWDDGAQVTEPHDRKIMEEVNGITDLSQIKFANIEEAKKNGLFIVIGKEIDDEYVKNVTAQVQNKDALIKNSQNLKVVFSPLHGTGNKLVRRVLKEVGFNHVYVVKEQELPDKNFTTVGYPNPEDPKVFELGIKLAEETGADIVVATDPDADRVGAAVKNDKGDYIIITGNMTGTLLTHFILSSKKEAGTMPSNGVVIKTIVTTGMIKPICEEFGAEIIDCLTGFKYIGGKIKEFEQTNEHTYIFGFEESYGCLCGTYARDKDAVVATMLICELAAKLKAEGKTLFDGIIDLYKKYGYFKEAVKSISVAGAEGLSKMAGLMSGLRDNNIETLGGVKIAFKSDYKLSKRINTVTKAEQDIMLPKSDVLKFELTDGSWVCVRPSGTEPKIKFYIGVSAETAEEADEKIAKISKDVSELEKGL